MMFSEHYQLVQCTRQSDGVPLVGWLGGIGDSQVFEGCVLEARLVDGVPTLECSPVRFFQDEITYTLLELFSWRRRGDGEKPYHQFVNGRYVVPCIANEDARVYRHCFDDEYRLVKRHLVTFVPVLRDGGALHIEHTVELEP